MKSETAWKIVFIFVLALFVTLVVGWGLQTSSAALTHVNPIYESADPSVIGHINCDQVKTYGGLCIRNGQEGRCGLDDDAKCKCMKGGQEL